MVKRLILLAIGVMGWSWMASCGLAGKGTGPSDQGLRAEAVIEAEAGLEGAVRIDSVAWQPTFLGFEEGGLPGELEGRFRARFANLIGQELQIRYDLRFYDRDDFLIDAFIPFGQPVRLASRQVQRVEGTFLLRPRDPRSLEAIALMRLCAKVALPEE